MKKTLSALLAGVLLAAGMFAGCGPGDEPVRDSLKIGLALYDQYDTFVGELVNHFINLKQQKEQQDGVTITVLKQSADGNQQLQNSQVEGMLESGCDILLVNLVDRADAAVIIDRAMATDTPVLFFNRELVEEDLFRSDLFYYVGAEAMESGRMQGEIAAQLWFDPSRGIDKNGDGVMQYVMLEGEAGHQDAVVRTETAIKTVSEAGDGGIPLERLEDEIANWVRSEAEARMTQWLQTHGNAIEVVFANNDDMALGAIDALRRAEVPFAEWPAVVGIDGTTPGLEAVMLGEMAGTVLNDSFGQAQKLLELACALWFGGEMPELTQGTYIRLPYQPVTPANIADYYTRTA